MKTSKLIMMVMSVGLLLVPGAKASLYFSSTSSAAGHFHGSSDPSANSLSSCLGISSSQLGSLVYQCNYDGSKYGTLSDSYNCLYSQQTSCSLGYDGGSFADATCLLVKDSNNNCYVWKIDGSWDGLDDIDLSNVCRHGAHITCIELYGNCQPPVPHTAVPEPSTIAAGICLLIPLAFSMVRILRRKHSRSELI